MVLFLVALVVLLGLSGWFVLSPLWSEHEREDADERAPGRVLSDARRESARRELLWRLAHDRAAGRLSEEDYEAAVGRQDDRLPAEGRRGA